MHMRPDKLHPSHTSVSARIDRALLSRMTGQSGDRTTLEAICTELAISTAQSLETTASNALGLSLDVSFDDFDEGTFGEMLAAPEPDALMCRTAIGGWCETIILTGDNVFFIALMESMLGGPLPGESIILSRSLSDIELDVASDIFTHLANALKTAIAKPATEGICVDPATETHYTPDEIEEHLPHVLMKLVLTAGTLRAPFFIIMPQRPLLKTVVAQVTEQAAAPVDKPAWSEQLSTQVSQSHVALEAKIDLRQLNLDEVARLRIGDVIPFADEGPVRALLSASEQSLFWCEFGRSGNRYTVRVEEPYRHKQELMKELTCK